MIVPGQWNSPQPVDRRDGLECDGFPVRCRLPAPTRCCRPAQTLVEPTIPFTAPAPSLWGLLQTMVAWARGSGTEYCRKPRVKSKIYANAACRWPLDFRCVRKSVLRRPASSKSCGSRKANPVRSHVACPTHGCALNPVGLFALSAERVGLLAQTDGWGGTDEELHRGPPRARPRL